MALRGLEPGVEVSTWSAGANVVCTVEPLSSQAEDMLPLRIGDVGRLWRVSRVRHLEVLSSCLKFDLWVSEVQLREEMM
jgi:hypothetical protein